MANRENQYQENAPGKFYVDDQCTDCDLCRERVPAVFARSDTGGHSYVVRQPESKEETRECLEALDDCPVEAIGADGACVVVA